MIFENHLHLDGEKIWPPQNLILMRQLYGLLTTISLAENFAFVPLVVLGRKIGWYGNIADYSWSFFDALSIAIFWTRNSAVQWGRHLPQVEAEHKENNRSRSPGIVSTSINTNTIKSNMTAHNLLLTVYFIQLGRAGPKCMLCSYTSFVLSFSVC